MKKNSRIAVMREMAPFWKGKEKSAAGALIAKLMCVLLGLAVPFMYRYFMAHVIGEANRMRLVYVVLGYGGLCASLCIFGVMEKTFGNMFKNILRFCLKKELLSRYGSISFQEYGKYNLGDLRNRVESDVKVAEEFYSKHVADCFFSLLSIVLLIFIMVYMNWQLTLYGGVGVGISFFTTNVIGARLKNMAEKYRANSGEFEGILLYSLHNWKEIKTNNLEMQQGKILDAKWREIGRLMRIQTVYKYMSSATVALNMFVVTRLGMYFFGGILVLNNYIDVASLLVFMTYYDKLHSEIDVLTQAIIQYREERPLIDRVMDMVYMKTCPKKQIRAKGSMEVENLSFRYEGNETEILSRVNMQVREKIHLAIVGKSGCGKSTLLKLMLGLLEPSEGSVRIGGVDVREMTDKSKSKTICAVMQDPQFFNISIEENLRLVKSDATYEELDIVCKMANIYDFIHELPQGYQTLIGEKGVKLSGGQLQRLAIARVLLRNPDIIAFDEATSALDNENEKAVVLAIHNLAEQKTILSVAHRLSSIREADEIVLLKGGRILERGALPELLENSKDFCLLYEQQLP